MKTNPYNPETPLPMARASWDAHERLEHLASSTHGSMSAATCSMSPSASRARLTSWGAA